MRLGISSWTYPWSIGLPGFPPPSHPFRLADLFTRASQLKVGVVQIADNLPLHALDSGELRDAVDHAADLHLTIEVGTRGVEPAQLLRYLNLAVSFDAKFVRTLIDSANAQPSLEQAEKWIREVLPEFEAYGITLGLENYEAHSCSEIASLVRRLENKHVGICLDTVNSLGSLETPHYVVTTLAPLTVNLHVKDFVIKRVPQKMGFDVVGVPAGSGQLDIPWVLQQMPVANNMSAILEQWPPFGSSVEKAAELEQQWASRGVEYLRFCGCT